MREIKFRAWDGEDMLTNLDSVNLEELSKGVLQFGSEIEDQQRVTFMQFTGLKDKNGKEIYEGDIVTWDEQPCEVKWHDGGFHIDPFVKPFKPMCLGMSDYSDLEIIGNAYENSHLLSPAPTTEEGHE